MANGFSRQVYPVNKKELVNRLVLRLFGDFLLYREVTLRVPSA